MENGESLHPIRKNITGWIAVRTQIFRVDCAPNLCYTVLDIIWQLFANAGVWNYGKNFVYLSWQYYKKVSKSLIPKALIVYI